MSQDLVEKILLLVATGLLTGIVAPYVLKLVDERRTRAQRILEADLARQAKLIDAQSALLDHISRLLWQYQLNAIEVSYYNDHSNQLLYEESLSKYEKSAGDLLGQIRAEISRALISPAPRHMSV